MSDTDPHDNSDTNLINFSDPSSDSSSGEVYVPTTDYDSDDSRKDVLETPKNTLNEINNLIDKVDLTLAETRYFL